MTDFTIWHAAGLQKNASVIFAICILHHSFVRSFSLERFKGADLEIAPSFPCRVEFASIFNFTEVMLVRICIYNDGPTQFIRRRYIDRDHRLRLWVNCNLNSRLMPFIIFQVMPLPPPVCLSVRSLILLNRFFFLLLQSARFAAFYFSFLFSLYSENGRIYRYDSPTVCSEWKRMPTSKLLLLINHCLRLAPGTQEKSKWRKWEDAETFSNKLQLNGWGPNFEGNAKRHASPRSKLVRNTIIIIGANAFNWLICFRFHLSQIRSLRWTILIPSIGSTNEQRTPIRMKKSTAAHLLWKWIMMQEQNQIAHSYYEFGQWEWDRGAFEWVARPWKIEDVKIVVNEVRVSRARARQDDKATNGSGT